MSTSVMTPYLSGFVDFVGENAHYAFIAVFLLALSEAIPVIGTVVPGSTLIIAMFQAPSRMDRVGSRSSSGHSSGSRRCA